MTDWYSTFDAVFFLSGATIFCGGLGVMLNYCFKSKCNEFSILGPHGLFYIERNVVAENEETEMELKHTPHIPASRRGSAIV
jgi:hypothetical protein